MRGTVYWMNSPMGRAILVALGFIVAMAGLIFFTGVAAVALMILGLVILIVGAGLGGPAGVRRRGDLPPGAPDRR